MPTALERYVSSTLMLCLAAERQGDLFGLATFAAGVQRFLRAKNGAAHFDACRETIYALDPSPVTPTAEDVYRRLGGHLQWQKLRERELLLRRAGVRVALLDPDRMTEQLVTQYMNVKRRQIL